MMLIPQTGAWLLTDSFVLRMRKEAPSLLEAVPVVKKEASSSSEEIRYGSFEIEGKEIAAKGAFEQVFDTWPEERRDLGDYKEFPTDGFDINKETLRVFVPESYKAGEAHGMLIFISAGDGLYQFSPEWKSVFEEKQIIWATAKDIGNKKPSGRRFRLAREARNYLGRHYRIDPQRVYLSGFSGGGRMSAGMIAKFPGSFTGTIHFCGVSALARAIPHYSKANVEIYGWPPEGNALNTAKRLNHFALITGPKDSNYEDTKNVFGWMEKNRIPARLIEVPGLAHQVPREPGPIREAIEFLDQPRKSVKSESDDSEENAPWSRDLEQLSRLAATQPVKARAFAVQLWDRHAEIHNDASFLQLLEKLEQWPSP
ncbi:MAG: hypothetical protein QM496_14245 [Verrucomicrobiota bacterium]